MMVVNQYIGVSGGYLGDFSYRTHAEFYPEYCDLDIDPNQHEGTTRERFITILSSLEPRDQAKVLRGVIERFPLGQDPPTRTRGLQQRLDGIIERLEPGPNVLSVTPRVASEVVHRALADAEHLIKSSGSASGVDRVATALHGYLLAVCDETQIPYPDDASMVALFKLIRNNHPTMQNVGPRGGDVHLSRGFASDGYEDPSSPRPGIGTVAMKTRALVPVLSLVGVLAGACGGGSPAGPTASASPRPTTSSPPLSPSPTDDARETLDELCALIQGELKPVLDDVLKGATTFDRAGEQLEDIRQRMRDLVRALREAGETTLADDVDVMVTHVGRFLVVLQQYDTVGVTDSASALGQDINGLVVDGLTC